MKGPKDKGMLEVLHAEFQETRINGVYSIQLTYRWGDSIRVAVEPFAKSF